MTISLSERPIVEREHILKGINRWNYLQRRFVGGPDSFRRSREGSEHMRTEERTLSQAINFFNNPETPASIALLVGDQAINSFHILGGGVDPTVSELSDPSERFQPGATIKLTQAVLERSLYGLARYQLFIGESESSMIHYADMAKTLLSENGGSLLIVPSATEPVPSESE